MNDTTQNGDDATREHPKAGEPVPDILPVMPLNNIVIYPFMISPIMVTDHQTATLVEEALVKDRIIGIFTTPPEKTGEDKPRTGAAPEPLDLALDSESSARLRIYAVGTAVSILKMLKIPDGSIRLLVHGLKRIRFENILQTQPYLKARISPCEDFVMVNQELSAMMKSAQTMLQKMVELGSLPEDVLVAAVNLTDPSKLSDIIASNLALPIEERQRVLEVIGPRDRLQLVLELLNRELEMMLIGNKIQSKVKHTIDKSQREYYLREQLRAIKSELGETDETPVEIRELQERIEKGELPEKPREVAERELHRLMKMHPSSAEYTVSATYLDWLVELPWARATRDNYDLRKAARVLDEDHYGLEKVKGRILEHLAVIKLKKKIRGPILCFVGPPGVGKTSLGQSIARALGRKFYRFSVGGMRDEAEIRGHRRTYIGAMPGRILKGLRDCGVNNPIIMLDEIDKLGADYRGDPASALLETLDPEQNGTFTDNYLDMSFDLSNVMFLTTANILDPIPTPLLDRMEVIGLSGYTTREKIAIAEKYLVPRRTDATGLTAKNVEFTADSICALIENYTREAGVRNLERQIGSVCQKVARRIAEGDRAKVSVSREVVADMLGPERVIQDTTIRAGAPGVATGLAWTPTGGELLFIETTSTPGQGRLIVTGQLGEVMKESIQAAVSYLNSNQRELDLPAIAFARGNFHIHVPAGAIPKDGPSAGVAICAALFSLLRDIPFPEDVAVTGELSLTGRVLPIGGLKEKALAAHRAGIQRVIAPAYNEKDFQEIPEEARNGMRYFWVQSVEEALREIFPDEFCKSTGRKKAPKPQSADEPQAENSASEKEEPATKPSPAAQKKKTSGKKTSSAKKSAAKKQAPTKKKAPAKKASTAKKKAPPKAQAGKTRRGK